MAGVEALGERLEALGCVDLGDHLHVGVQVVGFGHQLRHPHRLVGVLVVAYAAIAAAAYLGVRRVVAVEGFGR
ncbi:hypothetical protein DJ68_01470 [Halorubrum sp. C3]|nr:hypothetical protein DJ68_01470 [Halorubrum sp. C3]